ncbi:mannose-6-phosphate isomerase, class I [Microbacterium aquimaris]|uniref:mannose-6-phosphate isomerase, class I n=1 Tax=Microbacterium aquimaris TaxID=459816 RepID=UPI002AD4D601|nr:mannose-6-phosphate isomerase, class I [Microbacterium aquimaris]MDZ8274531.1 mannose-6-phosphate isomerase, class I [Microbacterium aquimaris]
MLVSLTNTPLDYAWGSTDLIARLEGREPTGRPEAEVWLGDHPGNPAVTGDGRTLDAWLAEDGASVGAPAKLSFLLKLLAAGSPLSIQAHPSKAQAEAGFAREEREGIPRGAGHRTYRDDNHKPELIVAVSDEFHALAGLRPLADTHRLLALLGPAGAPLSARLEDADAETSLADTIAWLLSGDAQEEVDALIHAAVTAARGTEFDAELDLVAHVAEAYPSDPGVIVAMLMNLVVLAPGEGLYVPAGVLHAYVSGLGVELMAASDNVLRGGLTPKHIDVDELMTVLTPAPGPAPLVSAEEEGAGLWRYRTPAPDFSLRRADVDADRDVPVAVPETAILLVTTGSVTVQSGTEAVELTPGRSLLVTPEADGIALRGSGTAYIASTGGGVVAP